MHELALMQGIISIVDSEAKKQGFQICSQINIKMGEYSGVIPECLRECFHKWCLTDFRRNNKTIMLAPGTGFYSDPNMGRNQVRMAYVLEIKELKEALSLLGQALEEYNSLPKDK